MTGWEVLHELINQRGGGGQGDPYWVMLTAGYLFVLALFALASMFRRPRVYSPTRITHKAPAVDAVETTATEETGDHDVAGGGDRADSARVSIGAQQRWPADPVRPASV